MKATAVILAAGAGRRLGNYGGATSKAMVPLCKRPLIEWVIERLQHAGAARFVVVAHAADEPLQRLVRALPDTVLITQQQRLGIADAVVQALPALPQSYLACACDSLFEPADLREVLRTGQHERDIAVVGVQEMGEEATSTRSATELWDGLIERIIEKPAVGTTRSPIVALPLYWLTAAVTPHLRSAAAVGGERHVSTALNDFIAAGGRVRSVPVTGRIEITEPADVERAEALLLGQRPAGT